MTLMLDRVTILAVLFFGSLITGSAAAATDPLQQGGIGGTGAATIGRGIGGTGAPAPEGGIGGTGAQPESGTRMQALAGKVLFVQGQVVAINAARSRALSKGDPVRVGDTLTSGKDASLQLTMEDGGTLVLRPETRLLIESFTYNGVQDGSEHMALDLLAGGFRAVTGNIGKLHKENYSIRTPNASVGIMGTDHETFFVPVAPADQQAGAAPGTYDHVISGATVLQSEHGKLLIKPNQTGFAALDGSGPIILDKPFPIFFGPADTETHHEHNGDNSKAAEHNGSDSGNGGSYSGDNDNAGEHNGGNSGSGDSSNGDNYNAGEHGSHDAGRTDPTSGSEHYNLTQSDGMANGILDINTFVETDATPAASGSAVTGAQIAGSQLSVGSARSGYPGEQLLTEEDVPSNYFNSGSGFNFNDHDATEEAHGKAIVDGVNVSWGIYDGGIAFDASGNVIPVDFHPYAFVEAGTTPPAVVSGIGGVASFSTVAGNTPPVTEAGATGGSITLNVGIDLGASTATRYDLTVTDADSRNWSGTLDHPVALSTFANGMPLSVNCSGTSCGSGMGNGSAAGLLIGPAARGLISSYVLSTTTGQAVAGAVVLSRP